VEEFNDLDEGQSPSAQSRRYDAATEQTADNSKPFSRSTVMYKRLYKVGEARFQNYEARYVLSFTKSY